MIRYKNAPNPLKRFTLMLKLDFKDIKNVYAYSAFNGLVNLAVPLGIQGIINFIQAGQISTSWILLTVLVVGAIALTGVIQMLQLRITENLQQKIFARASFDFALRLPRIKTEILNKYYPPELMNRFFDVLTIQKGLSKILIDFSTAAFFVVLGLIMLSLYHTFFIIFSFTLVIILYIIFKYTAKKGLQTSLNESEHKYAVAHWLEEIARVSYTFRLAANSNLYLEKLDSRVNNYLNSRQNHFKVLMSQYSLLVVFKSLVALGLLAIGGFLVMKQLMSIGQFVAAEIIILLIMSSVEKLILSLETIYDVITALEKVGYVSDLPLEKEKGIILDAKNMEKGMKIEIHNLNFSYPNAKNNVLENIHIDFNAGEKWVITGKNGSGKSTLLNLLSCMYEIKEGQISFMNFPMGNLDLVYLRHHISNFFSENDVFSGTIMENITVGKKSITINDVSNIADKVNLSYFIKSLPLGYETIIDPNGLKLPRSIKEKILLARCIITKPSLLIIDDNLEHIDTKDRSKLIDIIVNKENPWTLVAVSNDLELLQKATHIAYMEGNTIIWSGTTNEYTEFIKNKKENNNA